jgi:hypothetical protein
MNIQWVLSDDFILDNAEQLSAMRQAGSFWGSWRTWRAYNTDNVVCHKVGKAQELVSRQFQTRCNFYIPNSVYQSLDRPAGVRVYEGDFMGHDVENQDEIVALNLAGSIADVVLLLGFDWSEQPEPTDPVQKRRHTAYQGLVKQAVSTRPNVQWILVDHSTALRPTLSDLKNLDRDNLIQVLKLLNG